MGASLEAAGWEGSLVLGTSLRSAPKEGPQGHAGRCYFRMLSREQVGHIAPLDAMPWDQQGQHRAVPSTAVSLLVWQASHSSGSRRRYLARCPRCAAHHQVLRTTDLAECFLGRRAALLSSADQKPGPCLHSKLSSCLQDSKHTSFTPGSIFTAVMTPCSTPAPPRQLVPDRGAMAPSSLHSRVTYRG